MASRRLRPTDWAVRLAVAGFFLVVGLEKVTGTSWDEMFAAIGFGRWLQLLTGGLQIGGALLLLIPPTSRLGAALLGCTMLGAIAAHLFILDTGVGGAIVPALLLVFIIAAALVGRGGDDAAPSQLDLRNL